VPDVPGLVRIHLPVEVEKDVEREKGLDAELTCMKMLVDAFRI